MDDPSYVPAATSYLPERRGSIEDEHLPLLLGYRPQPQIPHNHAYQCCVRCCTQVVSVPQTRNSSTGKPTLCPFILLQAFFKTVLLPSTSHCNLCFFPAAHWVSSSFSFVSSGPSTRVSNQFPITPSLFRLTFSPPPIFRKNGAAWVTTRGPQPPVFTPTRFYNTA